MDVVGVRVRSREILAVRVVLGFNCDRNIRVWLEWTNEKNRDSFIARKLETFTHLSRVRQSLGN
jgi:hypothetical protein